MVPYFQYQMDRYVESRMPTPRSYKSNDILNTSLAAFLSWELPLSSLLSQIEKFTLIRRQISRHLTFSLIKYIIIQFHYSTTRTHSRTTPHLNKLRCLFLPHQQIPMPNAINLKQAVRFIHHSIGMHRGIWQRFTFLSFPFQADFSNILMCEYYVDIREQKAFCAENQVWGDKNRNISFKNKISMIYKCNFQGFFNAL